MKFSNFDRTIIDNFVTSEIDDFVLDKTLNGLVKYVYSIGAPAREKTYLILQIGHALGIKDESVLLPYAAASELMMASAMNADDSFDDNKTRFGGEVLWVEIGKDRAHLVSYYMFGLLFEILKKYKAEEKPYELLMDYFFKLQKAQFDTLTLAKKLDSYTLNDLEKLCIDKAGRLFEYTASVPAYIAKNKIVEMREFGKLFGLALQYSSDFGDFNNQGFEIDKPTVRFEDFYTHQPNLVLVLTAQSGKITSKERDFFIREWMTISGVDERVENEILELIDKSGAIDMAKNIQDKLRLKLIRGVNSLPNKKTCQELTGLIDQMCRF